MIFNKLRPSSALPVLSSRGYGIQAGRKDVIGFNQTVSFETGISFDMPEKSYLVVIPPPVKGLLMTYSGGPTEGPPPDGGPGPGPMVAGEVTIHLTNISRDAFYIEPETLVGFLTFAEHGIFDEPAWSDPDAQALEAAKQEKADAIKEHDINIAKIDAKIKEPRVAPEEGVKGPKATADLKGPALHKAVMEEYQKSDGGSERKLHGGGSVPMPDAPKTAQGQTNTVNPVAAH